MTDYKLAKEAFVADNPGTSIWEIQLVSYALYSAVETLRPLPSSHPGSTPSSPLDRLLTSPIIDYITTFLPILLALTVFSDVPVVYNAVIGVIIVGLEMEGSLRGHWGRGHTNVRRRIPKPTRKAGPMTTRPPPTTGSSPSALTDLSPSTPSSREAPIHFPHLPYLTLHRTHLLILTTICILAVDFPIFPRRFGKTETFGTGLMDLGVGSFVLVGGVVGGGGWLKGEVGRVLNAGQGFGYGVGRSKMVRRPGLLQMRKAAKKAFPLVALGMIRVIMVKGVEYPEHITEYGVHWNFFFTLAAMPFVLPLFTAVRTRLGGRTRFWTLAAGLAAVNEIILHFYLQAWVLSPARNGLLAQNKEGLVSLPGYIAIYTIGVDLGTVVIPPDPGLFAILTGREPVAKGSKRHDGMQKVYMGSREPYETGKLLAWYAAASWTALGIFRVLGCSVTRRMANLPYVLWIVAFNSTFLLGYLAVETRYFPLVDGGDSSRRAVPPLLDAINKNGLALFLLANLLTGMINLSMKTMYTGTTTSLLILAAYTIAFSVGAWTLRTIRIAL